MKHPAPFPLIRFLFVLVFVRGGGWMQKCITWTHILIFSHTPNLTPLPFMANMPHRLTHSPIFAKMHNPTTYREFYCRVRYMYPTESNPHLLECLAAKLLTQPIDVPIPSYWIPNRTPLRYQIPLPILLFYYVQIDLASNANTPPPFKYSVVSGEFGTLWTPTLFLYFGERRTKIYTLSTWQVNHNIYLENYGSFSKLCSFKKCHRKPDAKCNTQAVTRALKSV